MRQHEDKEGRKGVKGAMQMQKLMLKKKGARGQGVKVQANIYLTP